MKNIAWLYVYKPRHSWHPQRTTTRCAYAVHEGGHSVGFVQCTRAPTTVIDSYGFCTQHAKMIRAPAQRGT